MIDRCSKVSWFKEVYRVEVGHVHPPRVGLRTLRTVLLIKRKIMYKKIIK